MQLLVDISAHGLGHLAQTAPVLNALRRLRPDLRLTVRSGLARDTLQARIDGAFNHVLATSDFGLVMRNAVDIDLDASAARYFEFHADWPARVAAEAAWQQYMKFDAVLANAAYLPLAGAARAGVPAVGLSSLNWADMLGHYFGGNSQMGAIRADVLAAYNAARCFLCLTPGLPMTDIERCLSIPPVAVIGVADRPYFSQSLVLDESKRWLLVAMGGMDSPLRPESLPRIPGAIWLLMGAGGSGRDDQHGLPPLLPRFSDLLASADAVLTKPGYGTFVEAACAGTPVLYLERPDWPETPHFAAWLADHARAVQVAREACSDADQIRLRLEHLWALPAPPRPVADGAVRAAEVLTRVFAGGEAQGND